MIRGRRRGDAARNDEKEGELTDRGLRGGVGRDELAEVLRVVARPTAQGASHRRLLRRRCWVLAVISVPSPTPATLPAPFSPQVSDGLVSRPRGVVHRATLLYFSPLILGLLPNGPREVPGSVCFLEE
jgi:hypothetical protein